MKMDFILILIILLVLTLSACVSDIESKQSPELLQEEMSTHVEKSDASIQNTENQDMEKVKSETSTAVKVEVEDNQMKLQIGDQIFIATLADNSSAAALKEILEAGPITIDMRDYGNMEKVGSLGTDLPRNDMQITTEPGDLILYQGNAFVIYYAPNSWSFTRIGKINDVTQKELKDALGSGDVRVTLSMN
jgi:hypothetical protein